MEPDSTTTDTETPRVTLEEAAKAARRLVSSDMIKKEALAAVFEQAFSQPIAGPRYAAEVYDLAAFISSAGGDPDDDIDIRMLALAFDHIMFSRAARHTDPVWRAIHHDLLRAVAVFFVRREAIAQVDIARDPDAAEYLSTGIARRKIHEAVDEYLQTEDPDEETSKLRQLTAIVCGGGR